jgi:tight adherence protein C
MPPIVTAAAAVIAAAVAGLGWLILAPRDRSRSEILTNASHGFGAPDAGTNQKSRRGAPADLARRLTPSSVVTRLDRQLSLAGRPPAWPLHRILLAKLILPGAAAVLGLLFLSADPTPGRILLAGTVLVVSHFIPDLLLQSRGQERQTKIGLELPDTLDQMTIAVEAGLGFEAAMMRAAKNGTGPFAEELIRTLQDMQFGQSRREAYLALAERSTVTELRRFLRAVIQADAYGIAIADVLRTQANEMRLKRRQRAEEKAMKIPVKVIFPLMLCILPALFIVLLGPAVIDMMKAFSGV